MDRKPMALALLLTSIGTHVASWRMPGAPLGRSTDFDFCEGVAHNAEHAGYDLLFIADTLYVETQGADIARRYPRHAHLEFEPITLLAALSRVTTRIGLAATISTTYAQPYAVARAIASLDHLSNGRAGWNVVTSQSDLEARNFGLDLHARHAERYALAAEFVDVVTRLWDSWEEDAVVADVASGAAVDPAKLHRLDHRGSYYSVAGPLNIRRPPQGRPLVIQAGSSGPGMDLAAATADIVFTAQETKEGAQAFRRAIHDRLPAHARTPGSVLVMPGVFAIVGETEREAQAKFAALQNLIDPRVGLALLSNVLQVDLTGHDVDGPLPPIEETNASQSRLAVIRAMGVEGLSIRQIYTRLAPARGHLTLVGSADRVADTLVDWYRDEAADGFMLVPAVMPAAQDDFDRLVIPRLKDRGVMRAQSQTDTLRGRLGLPVPANRFADLSAEIR